MYIIAIKAYITC